MKKIILFVSLSCYTVTINAQSWAIWPQKAFSASDSSLVWNNATKKFSRVLVPTSGGTVTYISSKGFGINTAVTNPSTTPYLTVTQKFDNSTIDTLGSGNTLQVKNGGITGAKIANSTIDLTTKVTGLLPDANIASATTWNAKLTGSLTSGNIFVGDGSNLAFSRTLALNTSGGTFGLSNLGVLTMPDATTTTRGLLSTTDYTNILGTKTASYAYLAPLTGGKALFRYIRKQDLENQYDKLGNIITSTWGSLTGWTNYGSATITVASNELVLNNASGTLDFTSGTSNTAYGNSNLDQVTITEPIRVGTINSTNFGVGINLKSNYGVAGSKRSIGVRVGFDTGNVGRLYFYQSDGTGILLNTDAKSSNLPSASISAGDALTLQLTFYRNTYVATLYKGNKSINTFTYIVPSTSPLGQDFVRQNCWQYSIQSYGGLNYITTGFTVRADNAKSSPILYIGDSLTWGQGATSTSNTFTSLINKLTGAECTIYASPGNRTDEVVVSEVLALQPRVIFMMIGTNNIAKGDNAATFATKYSTLVNALIAGGYTVGVNLFLSTLPPFSINVTNYNTEIVNYIASLSSPNVNTYFDSYALLRNGTLTTLPTNYTDDGTHLTDIAQAVLAKGIYAYLADFLPYSSLKLSDQIPLYKDTYGNALIGGAGGTKSLIARLQVAGDQTGAVTPSLFQVTDNPNTGGLYMTGSTAGGVLIGFNSQFTGSTHVPYTTETNNLQSINGDINIFANSGLTVGTPYSLTKVFSTGITGTKVVTGNLAVGVTTASAKLHTVATTEQIRNGYDASNYWSATTGSTGITTFNAVGSGSAFVFSDPVTVASNITISTVGNGFSIKEGTNATMGTATLTAGTVTVSTTRVTANSRIYLTVNGGTITNVGTPYVSGRTAATSFTITSTNVLDASNVAWVIVEPN